MYDPIKTHCPACDEPIVEPATAEYVAGLLLVPIGITLFTSGLYMIDAIPARLLYTIMGAVVGGTWVMLRTDPHIKINFESD